MCPPWITKRFRGQGIKKEGAPPAEGKRKEYHVVRQMHGIYCASFKTILTADANQMEDQIGKGSGEGLFSHWLIPEIFKSRIKHPLPYKEPSLSRRALLPRLFRKRVSSSNCSWPLCSLGSTI